MERHFFIIFFFMARIVQKKGALGHAARSIRGGGGTSVPICWYGSANMLVRKCKHVGTEVPTMLELPFMFGTSVHVGTSLVAPYMSVHVWYFRTC